MINKLTSGGEITMHKYIIMTLIGTDRVGIVDRVTKRVLEHHGNIEESKMARLSGEFVMLLLISVPAPQTEKIKSSLADLKNEGFHIFLKETKTGRTADYEGSLPYRLIVSGADHEGIINPITHFLAEKNINIESMDTSTSAAPMSGTLLFTMNAIIIVPSELSYHTWSDHLTEIADSMNVNIDISPYTG